MQPPGKSFCNKTSVSPWLYHSDVELTALLNFQFKLNKNLSSECKTKLSNHLCFLGIQCQKSENIGYYIQHAQKTM